MAARWGEVDFGKAQLRISRGADAYREEGSPKTAAGVRIVPLSAQLISALKAWTLQSQFSKPEDLIFTNRVGSYVGHDNLIKRQFAPLQPSFNWHGLRHFCSFNLDRSRAVAKDCADVRGHASLPVTMDRQGTCFRVRITGEQWIASPRHYSQER